MTKELKEFISNNFPEEKDFIIKFYSVEIPDFYNKYINTKGHKPSPNFLKALFLFPLPNFEEVSYSENTEHQYFQASRPTIFELNKKCFLGLAPCEGVSLISPLTYFGIDGCGGDFFTDFSSFDDTIYHTWEEYDGLSTIRETLSSLINKADNRTKTLYELLLKEFKTEFDIFKYTEKIDQYEFDNLDIYNDIPNISLQIYSDYYENEIDLTYSYDFFEYYFNSADSDYFKYDNIVAILNSKLMCACYCLYFARKKKKLRKLIETTSKAKGQNLNFIRNHFEKIIETKWDKFSHFYINKKKFTR